MLIRAIEKTLWNPTRVPYAQLNPIGQKLSKTCRIHSQHCVGSREPQYTAVELAEAGAIAMRLYRPME